MKCAIKILLVCIAIATVQAKLLRDEHQFNIITHTSPPPDTYETIRKSSGSRALYPNFDGLESKLNDIASNVREINQKMPKSP